MPVLEIRIDDDPILRTFAEEIAPEEFTTSLYRLATDMLKTCKSAGGIGLAAPQVGISKRIIVTKAPVPLVWVNPVLTLIPGGWITGPETCLSLPGVVVDVKRAKEVVVQYQDLHGKHQEETVKGPLSIVLQHEVDHLNGVLITDYKPKKEFANDQAVAV